jgi:mRNA-degrading endonuclease RelE of RelBE toxin-antitoxin system
MSYSIILTDRFEKELKRLSKKFPSLKNEFTDLVDIIKDGPEFGTFIGNNCFKILLAIGSKKKGKSGGARIITYLYKENEVLYLLTIYDKSEKVALKQNELKFTIDSLDFGA